MTVTLHRRSGAVDSAGGPGTGRLVCDVVFACLVIGATACERAPAIDTAQVSARRIQAALPSADPDAALWRDAPEHPAKLMVQDVTEPRLIAPGVQLMRVKALHDGGSIAFRLEWDDGAQDLVPESGHTSDAVAIQFPLVSGADVPDPAMGQPGKGVRIWYWKAVWQDDEARTRANGGDRVSTLYPRASVDHYPFQAAPVLGDAAVSSEMARRYAPARAAGNSITIRPDGGTVQVLAAEGFGATIPAASQAGSAFARWKDGRWAAVITRPIDAGVDLAPLAPGTRTYVAVAVWDGAARHAGSRKMRSGWIPLMLEAAQ